LKLLNTNNGICDETGFLDCLQKRYMTNTLFSAVTIWYRMDTVCYIMGRTSSKAGGEFKNESRKVMKTTTMMRETAIYASARPETTEEDWTA
jgi:hypothetical protein